MPHAGVNHEDVLVDSENETVGGVNSGPPPSCAIPFEGFRLTEAGISVAVNALEKQMQTPQGLAVK